MSRQSVSATFRSTRKKGWWFYMRRIGLSVVVLVALLAAIGAVYESIAARRDMGILKPSGRLVDMGGYKLHLYCTGFSNPPDITVVLESGLSSTTSSWARIQADLASSVRVCSYDRGGIGWSDPTERPRDGKGISGELHELLLRANINGTLVLVGHSSGGLYARAFQAEYPERVAALTLIDSSHEDQFTRTTDGGSYFKTLRGAYSVLPIAARLGVVRLSPLCNLPELPPDARRAFHAACSRSSFWVAGRSELESLQAAMQQVRGKTLGSLPLVVLTAGRDPQNPANWGELQNELAALSMRTTHIVRPDATHPGLLLNPEDARQCVIAVLDVVKAVRQTSTKGN